MNEKGRISSLSRIEQWRRKKEEKNREKIENDEKNREKSFKCPTTPTEKQRGTECENVNNAFH